MSNFCLLLPHHWVANFVTTDHYSLCIRLHVFHASKKNKKNLLKNKGGRKEGRKKIRNSGLDDFGIREDRFILQQEEQMLSPPALKQNFELKVTYSKLKGKHSKVSKDYQIHDFVCHLRC